MSIAYFNGSFMPPEDVVIPLSDRSVFFGDGVYDAAIGSNGKIYMLDEHIDRFISNAARMDIRTVTKERLKEILENALLLSGENFAFLYFQATRSLKERRHSAFGCTESNLLLTATAIPKPSPERTLSLSLYEDMRYFYCDVKTLNLLPGVLSATDAEKRGFDEAVFHRCGVVTECSHSNIFAIKNGELYTHPSGRMILPGTARKRLIEIAKKEGIVCHCIPFSTEFLLSADEALVTSSTKLCLRVGRIEDRIFTIDDRSIGTMLTEKMHMEFEHFFL